MSELNQLINQWIDYALKNHMIEDDDIVYVINHLRILFDDQGIEKINLEKDEDPCLKDLVQYVLDNKLVEQVSMPAFVGRFMDIFLPRPSEISRTFRQYYKRSPQQAIRYFHDLVTHSQWINQDIFNKDEKSLLNDSYKEFNCFDLMTLEALSSQMHFRQTSISFANEKNGWFLFYLPKPMYHQESLVYRKDKKHAYVNEKSFNEMIDFINKFPHYFIANKEGFSCDDEIHHYHVGSDTFPLEKADVLMTYKQRRIKIEVLDWPLPVIRLNANNENKLLDEIHYLYQAWKKLIGDDTMASVNLLVKLDGSNFNVYMFFRMYDPSNKEVYEEMDIRHFMGFKSDLQDSNQISKDLLLEIERNNPLLKSYPEDFISFVKKAM